MFTTRRLCQTLDVLAPRGAAFYKWVPPAIQSRNIPSEILSAYRGLLRAASYLPDSLARKYACERIKNRFRASRAKPGSKLGRLAYIQQDKPEGFALQRLKTARRSRTLLENAGNGDMDALKKVLLAVHGREGERKRWLLKDLLQADEGALPKDASALQELIDNPEGAKKEDYVLDKKVYNFIRSQQENQPVEAHKNKIRQLKAKIPKENIWGRSLPLKLKASMQKKWWADTLEKILPPIPRSEWERLRDLATGAIPLETQPARRTPLQTTEEELSSEEKSEKLLKHFQAPARPTMYYKPSLDSPQEMEGLTEIRNRSLRRLYASIWSLTPTMTYDDVSKNWTIEWGGQKSRAMEGAVSKPTLAEEELFEGLDTLPQTLSKAEQSQGRRNSGVKHVRRDEASERLTEKMEEVRQVANPS
ncbi:hypothetical protein BKA65DRAFT_394902 [Rhexocercosporidium sp. MPI-PUGE-AT-0058]|nr:hypothetical protein BKA65DRAFT_394902 [Rhexocercosporidium sp. MPI-PUGE-AT-0058]